MKNNHVEKTFHPCQFPIEVVERLVLSLTNEYDLVFDPFLGVGSAAAEAVKNKRRGMGCEIMEEYYNIAVERTKLAIRNYNQTDFVKSRVDIEVQFGKYAFVAYDLFVKRLAFYIGNYIDVGIEILPMKTLQSQMSSGPSYYEGELYNVVSKAGEYLPFLL